MNCFIKSLKARNFHDKIQISSSESMQKNKVFILPFMINESLYTERILAFYKL